MRLHGGRRVFLVGNSIRVLYVSRCIYNEQNDLENHYHPYHHLIGITSGKGKILINGEAHLVQKNDLFLMQPLNYHEMNSDLAFPIHTFEIRFVTEQPLFKERIGQLPLKGHDSSGKTTTMMENLFQEALRKDALFQEAIIVKVFELLIFLIRMHSTDIQPQGMTTKTIPTADKKHHELADQMRSYIHEHYTVQLNLVQLSETFNMNKSYLCHIFSKNYSVSPIQYANHLKLQKSKELLAETELSITKIAELVGFASIHYMSRFFTLKENMTPSEYRLKFGSTVHVALDKQEDG